MSDRPGTIKYRREHGVPFSAVYAQFKVVIYILLIGVSLAAIVWNAWKTPWHIIWSVPFAGVVASYTYYIAQTLRQSSNCPYVITDNELVAGFCRHRLSAYSQFRINVCGDYFILRLRRNGNKKEDRRRYVYNTKILQVLLEVLSKQYSVTIVESSVGKYQYQSLHIQPCGTRYAQLNVVHDKHSIRAIRKFNFQEQFNEILTHLEKAVDKQIELIESGEDFSEEYVNEDDVRITVSSQYGIFFCKDTTVPPSQLT